MNNKIININKKITFDPIDVIKIIELINDDEYECIDLGWGKVIYKKQNNKEVEDELNR